MGIATKSRFCLEMANAGTRVTRSRILLKYITTEVRVFFLHRAISRASDSSNGHSFSSSGSSVAASNVQRILQLPAKAQHDLWLPLAATSSPKHQLFFQQQSIGHCSWLGISFEKVKFTPGATTYGAVLPSSLSFLWWKKLDVQNLPACTEGHQCQSQMDNHREVVRLGEAVPILVSNYQWLLVRG